MNRFVLSAIVASACFCGLARAGGGYGAAQQAFVPQRQFVPVQRQRVDVVNEVEYVPQVRQRAVVRNEVEYVPVQSAPAFAPCAPQAAFGAGYGVGAASFGRLRQRSFSLQIQRSRFR